MPLSSCGLGSVVLDGVSVTHGDHSNIESGVWGVSGGGHRVAGGGLWSLCRKRCGGGQGVFRLIELVCFGVVVALPAVPRGVVPFCSLLVEPVALVGRSRFVRCGRCFLFCRPKPPPHCLP